MHKRQVAMKSTSKASSSRGSANGKGDGDVRGREGRGKGGKESKLTNGRGPSRSKNTPSPPRARRRLSGDLALEEEESADGTPPLMPPRQDPAIRRQIRLKYSLLKEQAQVNQNELIRPGSDHLTRILEETDEVFKDVQETREAAMDSNMVAFISKLAKQQAQALHTDFHVFEPVEFSERLITLLNGNRLPEADRNRACLSKEAWEKLGEAAQPFFKRSPPLHVMFGAFERGPPKERVRNPKAPVRRVIDKAEAGPSAPKQLKNFAETDRQEVTTVEVEKILKTLQDYYESSERKPICFFEFIINPTSFGQTVENLFYASFLVRDGLARIFLDDDKLPVIEPVYRRKGDDAASRVPRHQVVMTMTMEEWRALIDTFQIKGVIESRNSRGNHD